MTFQLPIIIHFAEQADAVREGLRAASHLFFWANLNRSLVVRLLAPAMEGAG